ncbi:MAG: inositol monophosphatase [Proteobacteria bacterium]|nr:inositol monophosphatase [Pseudomonadota bacterium]
MLISRDIEAVSRLIRRAAEEHILPRFQRLAAHDIAEKGPGDLVTIADTEAEKFLTPELERVVRGSVVVGEEAVARDRTILQRLNGARPVWLIDPVDGTYNFANAKPVFAVIVALVEGGSVSAGWIHDPLRNVTITATAGGGAWLDGTRLAVPSAPPLRQMAGSLSGRLEDRGRARDIAAKSGKLGPTVQLRCAGREYIDLVEGRLNYAFFTRTYPWDHAAGWLIHREAGGHGAFLDGKPYTPLRHQGPLMLAPSAAAWIAIRNVLTTAPA